MTALARKLLTLFGVLGLAASAAAAWVHYHLLANPDYASFCDISATVSCKQAYLSRYGSVAGVPVAVGGLIFFTLVVLLVWAGRRGRPAADSAPGYLFALSTIGLAVVLYLGYASFFILKEVCPLCVATYVAVIGVFIVSGGANVLPMSRLPGRAMRDIGVLVRRPLASIVALLFLGGAVGALAFFPRPQEAALAAQVPAPALTGDQRSEFERWWDLQERVELPYSKDGAKVLIVKFNDYQCPPCKQTYYAFEPVLARHQPSDVKYLMKHFPLDPKCNPALTELVHPAACDAAAAAVMARSKGTVDKLTAWFFAHQDELSPATVRTAAKEVGGIGDFDSQYAAAIQAVRAEAVEGGTFGVRKTPTFFINGRRLEGGLPPQYLEAAIEIELKRAK
jgi:uncharacterized membrane protein/predicted DsbA family dithiol-disulfide isomerase